MRTFKLILFFCLMTVFSFAQGLKQKLVGSTTNVQIISQTPNVSYVIQFNLTSFQGYAGLSVAIGDHYVVEYTLSNPKKAIRFQITAVSVVSGNRVQVTLVPLDGATLAVFPITTGGIYRPGNDFGLIPVDGSAPMFLEAAVRNHNTIRIDSLLKNHRDSIQFIMAALGGSSGGGSPAIIDSLARTVRESGLFDQYAIPFGSASGKLDQDVNVFKLVSGQLQVNSIATLGSAGAGYLALGAQSTPPATPVSGVRVYADGSGRFGWIGTNGLTRVFDASGITTNRNFKLQDKSYTLADSADVAALSTSLPGSYFPLLGGTLTGTGGAGFVGLPHQTTSPFPPTGGIRVYGNGSALSWVASDGYERQLASSGNTGGRTYILPNASGTIPLLSLAQTWSGNNTFAMAGSSGSGFSVTGTTQSAINAPVMTDVQVAALTSQTAGSWVYSNTQQRPYVYNGTAFQGIMLGPQSGIPANYIPIGGSGRNLTADGNFVVGYNGSNPILYVRGRNAIEVDVNGQMTFGTGGNPTRFTTAVRFENLIENPTTTLLVRGNGGVILNSTPIGNIMYLYADGVNINYNSPGQPTGDGIVFRNQSGKTHNNTSTAASGTVSSVSMINFNGGHITSANTGVTYTNAATLRVSGAPTAGTNSTITKSWAIQVNSGVSMFPQVHVSQTGTHTWSQQAGIGHSYYQSSQLYAYSGQLGGSGSALTVQGHANGSGGDVFGVLSNLAINSIGNSGNSAAIRAETGGNPGVTAGMQSALYSYFRTAGGGNDMRGLTVELSLNKSNTYTSTGTLRGISVGVPERNNHGVVTLKGIEYTGLTGTISGGGSQITTHNPLAISAGSYNQVTSTWSFIDHALTIGASTQTSGGALLELSSTSRGFLPPRMTEVQRDAIPSPAAGLLIYNSTTGKLNYRNATAYVPVGDGIISALPTGDVSINAAGNSFVISNLFEWNFTDQDNSSIYSGDGFGLVLSSPIGVYLSQSGGSGSVSVEDGVSVSSGSLGLLSLNAGNTFRIIGYPESSYEIYTGNLTVPFGRITEFGFLLTDIDNTDINDFSIFETISTTKFSIPAPVMTATQRDILEADGVDGAMIYSSTAGAHQVFNADLSVFQQYAKVGKENFWTEGAIPFGRASDNILLSDASFRYDPLLGTQDIATEFSRLRMYHDVSDTNLTAAVEVYSDLQSSDASYFLRLLKGVEGNHQDSVSIHMLDQGHLGFSSTKGFIFAAMNGGHTHFYTGVAVAGNNINTGTSYTISGKQSRYRVESTTVVDINLPQIGVDVQSGYILYLTVSNSAADVEIHCHASNSGIELDGAATGALPMLVTAPSGFIWAKILVANNNSTWSVLGN